MASQHPPPANGTSAGGMGDMDKEKLKQQAAQAQQLLLERTKTAYEGSKSLLRASHVINQYVSIVAGGLVAVSAVLAIIDILYKIGSTKNWFWGILTQVYIVAFGVAIIVLEVPIVERTKPVMAFKVFVDRWLRALSRLTARGIVYFTHAVLIIDAQHEFSRLGEFCGYFLFGAGIFSALVGYTTTHDLLKLKEKVRAENDRNGVVATAKAVFEQHDKDGNGTLSIDEVRKMVLDTNPEITDLELRVFFINLDVNRDNVISEDEFMVWYESSGFSANDLA